MPTSSSARRLANTKMKKVMHEYKEGKLHVGKTKKIVKAKKQAIAIALSEAKINKNGKRTKKTRK